MNLPLFHVPLLGGWKEYSVYEVKTPDSYFHIAWAVYEAGSNKLIQSAIHRRAIEGKHIRLLDGTPDRYAWFFAVDKQGKQIPLRRIGDGKIGDQHYGQIPLY